MYKSDDFKSSKLKSGKLKAIFSLLTVSIMATSYSPKGYSQDVETAIQDDTRLIITANRTEQDLNSTLAAVEVITRKDIERIQAESIVELLANIAGFDIASSGGAGQTASLFTRGTNSDHTLILVDGVRIGSATLGKKELSDIPIAQIERIEIVKGPRASLWGSDAIGGVIQIFTRRLKTGEYSISAKMGSDQFKATDLSFGFGSEKMTNTVTLSIEDSASFDVIDDSTDTSVNSEPDKDGYQRISAAIRGDYTLSEATNLDWVFQYDDGNTQFDNPFGGNKSEYNNYLWNIHYTYTLDKWKNEFSVKQSRDKSFTFDTRAAEKQGSVFQTRRDQINASSQYRFNDAVSLLGGVERYTDNVGKSKIVQFDGSIAEFEDSKRTSDAAFLSSVVKAGRFVSEVSARYDDVGSAGSESTFNISAGYNILDNITLSASRSKGFKAPTFNDLYFPGFSNPDLRSEVSYNTEFLLRGHWNKHSLLISRYDNQVNQLIAFVFNPVTFSFLPFNIDKASLKGHELVYQYQHGSFSHKLSGSFVKPIDKSIDVFSGEVKNEQLLRRAKEHYAYELIAELGDFSFFTQLNYSGRRPDNNFSTFSSTRVYLKSHMTVNLGATYQATERLSLKLKFKDLTQSQKPTVFNFNVPGRQVFLTLQYRNF